MAVYSVRPMAEGGVFARPDGPIPALRQKMQDAGLPSGFADLVIHYMREGLTEEQAVAHLRESQEWKQRFAGNELREKKGLRPLSPAEYIDKEKALAAQFEYYDLPPGFYDDPSDFAKMIGSDLGAQELGERLEARRAVVYDGALTGVRQWAKDKYGLTDGDLLAFWIDPDRATHAVVKRARAAQIGAAGARAGVDVSAQRAEYLTDLGLSVDQAAAGFSQAGALAPLTQTVGGDAGASQADVDAAVFEDNAAAKKRLERVASARKARFEQGGTFATSRTGFGGLGSANS